VKTNAPMLCIAISTTPAIAEYRNCTRLRMYAKIRINMLPA
jgi:hypothetical protein